jgi:hypothetical protein
VNVPGAGRSLRALLAGLVAIAMIAGCSFVPFDPTPDPEAGPGLVGDCVPPFVLDEETTLGALGLAQFEGMGADLVRRGSVRVTEATLRWEDFAPPGVAPLVAEGQLLCITWPDGGFTTLLHEPFRQGGVPAAPAESGDGPSVAVLVAAVAFIVVGGVSWLAFRRERPSGGT